LQTTHHGVSRRRVVALLAASVATTSGIAHASEWSRAADFVAKLERRTGGRIGLALLDTGSGRKLSHRGDERFALCSTFKLMLAAAILSETDAGKLRLVQGVPFVRSDLRSHSLIADTYPDGGTVSLQEMLRAAIVDGDNTAANLLLSFLGGPAGYTGYLRTLGDRVTRLDREELELNSNSPGDLRDTTTPKAMLHDMRCILINNRLSLASRERLLRWMRDSKTGPDRLRAHLPQGWSAGDKTGTGSRGAANDVAIVFPPGRRPILVACYMSGSTAPIEVLNAAHAQIGSLLASIVP
jgi:beta-lactamase class A